jgi:hypothetical protein
MNFWVLFVVLALMVPILAIVLDSRVGEALADRISSGGEDPSERERRIEALEAEVRYLSESLESLREETEFVRALVEGRGEDAEEDGPPRPR